MIDRAYSRLTIRSADEDQRRIRGLATSPATDRLGDIVEPLGVMFKNPLPLLRGHSADAPVGTVIFDAPSEDGIEFEAHLPRIEEPGPLRDRVDTAWGEIKSGLVRGVSIGFRAIEHAAMKTGGLRFLKTEVLELSLVPIPANADATIHMIKSIDAELRAATGRSVARGAGHSAAGASARPVKAVEASKMTTQTVADQIRTFENTRGAKAAAMDAIMGKAADAGTTLDAAQKEEHDGLDAELHEIDEHLKRLRDMEKRQAAGARAVDGGTAAGASTSRGNGAAGAGAGRVVFGRRELPKGTAFTRYVIALARSRGVLIQAAETAKIWRDETPEVEAVLRAAVAPGTVADADWAAPLVTYQQMANEFVELLRPATIIGRIPGLRRVPFMVKMPVVTQGSLVGWVGEAKPKPVGEMKFGSMTLEYAKAAGIIVLSKELIRLSTPSAEETVRTDLRDQMQQFLDVEFIDPAIAPVAGVSPGSILNGVAGIPSSGPTADDARSDVQAIYGAFIAANLGVGGAVWVTTETIALQLMGMRNPLGQREFAGVTAAGGEFEGLPMVTSQSVPVGIMALIKASEIFLADDGQTLIDASEEATLQMDSAPLAANPAVFSLWQNNCTGIRAEREINWKRRRDSAVAYVTGADYNGVVGP